MLRLSQCVILCAALVSAVGCSRPGSGPKLYPVSGKVTFAGKPVDAGEIIFSAADGSRVAGGQIEDGEYSLKATAGRQRVQITAMRDVPGEFREDNPGERVQAREQYIPPQYNSQSTLEANVDKASDAVNFELTP